MLDRRWRQVAELFDRLAELGPEERRAALREQSRDDAELAGEVEALLAAEGASADFLERPALPGLGPSGTAGEMESPARIGRYRVLQPLGEGGTSRVYLARRDDDVYLQQVAVKVLRRTRLDRELLRRFEVERQVLAGLEHPNIARILDGGQTELGLPYLVMEYVQGTPIDEHCDRLRLPIEDRLELLIQVCRAVGFAHRNLIVHRDIKPANVLVTDRGVPKLLDFGIAKLLSPDEFPIPVEPTMTGLRPMTPYYASPEQVEGRRVSTATDVYSLGALAYRLLSGRIPYRVETGGRREVEDAVLSQVPERLAAAAAKAPRRDAARTAKEPDLAEIAYRRRRSPDQLVRRLDSELDAIVRTCLAKAPGDRYPSTGALIDDLQRHLAGLPVTAHGNDWTYLLRKFVSRNRKAVVAASLFVTVVAASAIGLALQASRIVQQKVEVESERDRAEETVAFLKGLFAVSDPENSLGETVTARELLNRGARRLRAGGELRPGTRAALLETVGQVYQKLALYEESERALRESLQIRRTADHGTPAEHASSLASLGSLLIDLGEYEEAERSLSRALELRRAAFGVRSSEVAGTLRDLAQLHSELSDLPRAERLLDEALDILRVEARPALLAEALVTAGSVRRDSGQLEEAESLFREALDLRLRQHGEMHPKVAESLNELAVVTGMSGRPLEAAALFRRVLQIDLEIYDPWHPELAVSYHNIGRTYEDAGSYEQAATHYRQALEILERAYGGAHPDVGYLRTTLGFLALRRDEPTAAEREFRESLRIRRAALPAVHAETGVTLRGLGTALLEQQRPGEAEAHLREALRILQQTLPPDHHRIADAQSHLGWCLALLGRQGEADRLLRQGYESLLETRGPDHRRTRAALERLEGFGGRPTAPSPG